MAELRRRRGRPGRGERRRLEARLPVPLADAIEQEADRLGLSVTDLVGVTMAVRVGLTYNPEAHQPLADAS